MSPVLDGKDDGGARKFFSCNETNLLAKSKEILQLPWDKSMTTRLYLICGSAGSYFAVKNKSIITESLKF